MTAGQGFDLHPLAAQDITDIWEYIADDSLQAARRVREEILAALRGLGAVSECWTQTNRPHLAPFAVHRRS